MRVAIVGSGVSGLVSAHLLGRRHEVVLFEADDRLGGHVHTWDVELDRRRYAVDTGFIVFNERNYPNFTKLLNQLHVPSQPTTMSFGFRCDATNMEYNGSTARQLFAQKRNVFRPRFYKMLADVVRFNRHAAHDVANGSATASVGEYLEQKRFSGIFRDQYLLPMASSLWSTPRAQALEMPAKFLVQFFDNHGMLSVEGRPEWRVVSGGSARYVEALVRAFTGTVRLQTPVRRVERRADGVMANGEQFDEVVFACHSDQALAMLADATPDERTVLGALRYQSNEMLLHTDVSVLPRRQRAWGAWNYRVQSGDDAAATLTYNMNALQSIEAPVTFCATLNSAELIAPDKILGRAHYMHPVFSREGVAAQLRHKDVSGLDRTHYCGAYWGSGFHEDGVRSALAVAQSFGEAL